MRAAALFAMPSLVLAFRPSFVAWRGRLAAVSKAARYLSFADAERDALEQIAANRTRALTFNGFITRRRPMGSSLTFLDLVSADPEAREMQVWRGDAAAKGFRGVLLF